VTPQEQQLLTQLTQRINQTQLQEKDEDAQNLLGRELDSNPDALYIMAQTLLVQNLALEQLKSQVAQLQQQLQQARQQPAHATSFLGRLFGESAGEQAQPQQARPQQAYAPPQPYPPQAQPYVPQQPQGGWQPVPQYPQAPPPQYAPPQYPAPQYVATGQPSFFRGALQTAAGVAAGALAFEGVESLLHPFGHMGGWGPGMGGFGMGPGMGFGGGFQRPVEETVINNYYDQPGGMGSGERRVEHDSSGHDSSGHDFNGGQDFQGGERHFQNTDGSGAVYSDANYTGQDFNPAGADASAANDNLGAYDQNAYDQGLENDTVAADNSVDNVQIDDSGSGFEDGSGGDSGGFDDGGGFDNSGGDGF